MDDANRAFSGLCLKIAREDVRKAGIKVGKLTTWADRNRANSWYEVWEGDKTCSVWQGSAYDASEAKSKYLSSLMPDETDDEFDSFQESEDLREMEEEESLPDEG